MRFKLDYLKNKTIVIQGLGLNQGGVGAVKFLAPFAKKLIVTDLRDNQKLATSLKAIEPEIKNYNIELVLGGHREKDFINADILIKNPAVPPGNKYVEIAKARGAIVFTEVSLFMALYTGIVVGITGTKGKSTTTSILFHILKNILTNKKVILGGNIGKSVLTQLKNRPDIAVLEISSFVGDSLNEHKISPNLSVITNLYIDHLNWHKTFEHYKQSKLALFKHQTSEDLAVVNLDFNDALEFITEGSAYNVGVSEQESVSLKISGLLKKLYKIDQFQYPNLKWLKGKHNLVNAALAISAAAEYFNIPIKEALDVLKTYTPLSGRQEFIATKNGIDFYNDTAATLDIAAIHAAKRFGEEYNKNVVFIMGGVDKGIDYSALSKVLCKQIKAVVLFEGDASEKLASFLRDCSGIKVIKYVSSMKEAVAVAVKEAEFLKTIGAKKVAVVLCPAAASFNMFLNEWDRGERFVEAVSIIQE